MAVTTIILNCCDFNCFAAKPKNPKTWPQDLSSCWWAERLREHVKCLETKLVAAKPNPESDSGGDVDMEDLAASPKVTADLQAELVAFECDLKVLQP